MGTSSQFKNLPLSDNFMFGEVMRQEPVCKLFLEALLGQPVERIEWISKEETISDEPAYHGIRLDVFVMENGVRTMYDVEMEARRKDDLPRRIRYYQGMMDRRSLEKNKDYSQLPDSFIIYVCDYDHFGKGLAAYQREVAIKDCEDVIYDDGSRVYILNSRYTTPNTSPAILEFLDFVRKNDVEYEYNSELMKAVCPAVKKVRHDPDQEVRYMTLQMMLADERKAAHQEGVKMGVEMGVKAGRKEEREMSVCTMVVTLQELSVKPEDIVNILMQKFELSPETAREKFEKYSHSQ